MLARLFPRSVRGRSVLVVGVATAVFAVAVGAGATVLVSRNASATLGQVLSAEMTNARGYAFFLPRGTVTTLEPRRAANGELLTLTIFDGEGRLVAQTAAADGPVDLCLNATELPAGRTVVDSESGSSAGTYLRIVRQPGKKYVGTICGILSQASVARAQAAVIRTVGVGIPVVVVGVCVLVWLVLGRALRSVELMRRQAERIQNSTEVGLSVLPTGDEVERLGHTLNRLIQRLRSQAEVGTRLVADAGHELRNPLASLRVAVEFAEADVGSTPELQDALVELDRLEGLVQGLLVAARTEAHLPAMQFTDVDVREVIDEVVAARRKRGSRVAISVDCDPEMRIRSESGAVRSVIANLLDNAVRHAETMVTITARCTRDTFSVRVDDDGAGIPEADCTRVFDRFVRLQSDADSDIDGSGLGLAIVASIAAYHGGNAWASPGPGGHVGVTWPVGGEPTGSRQRRSGS